MFRGDSRGSGLQRDGSVPWIAGVRFTYQAAGAIRSSPVARGGVLYVGSTDGTLAALDARSGAVRWQFHAGGAITSTPAVDADTVYVTSRDRVLRALDERTGRERWRHRFGADLGQDDYWDYHMASPVLHEGTLFVGGGDGQVLAFDTARGRIKWRFDAGARVRATPAIHRGVVVVATHAGRVHALSEKDGTLLWSFATDGASRKFADVGNDTTSIVASPTIMDADGGAIVGVGGRDAQFYALDLLTGKLRWRITHDGSSWMLSSAGDAGTLYIGGGSAAIVQAVDAATGVERWRFKTRSAVFSALALAGDTLLTSDFFGSLYAIDRATGRKVWEFPLGARSLSTPLVAGGIAYAASDTGVLFALDVAPAMPTAAAEPRRIVYYEGPKSAQAFSWFLNGMDTVLAAQLKAAGYETMDATALASFMAQQTPASPAAVVVFADNRMPSTIVEAADGAAPVRRFLDAGGKVALLGPNPLAYKADAATGALEGIDFQPAGKVFGVAYPAPQEANGYYTNAPTAAGRAMGLRHAGVASSPVNAQPGLTMLARDEMGRAIAWLRSYGGKPGTGLLQLGLSRNETPDLAEVRAVIEYGVTW